MSAMRLDTNASYSGSMVTNGRASQGMPDFYDRCNIIGTPDNIFVALGTNDSGTSAALGEYDYDSAISDLSEEQFIPAYIKGIKTLKENYPTANIYLFIFYMKDKIFDQCIDEKLGKTEWVHIGLYNLKGQQRKMIFNITK